MSVTQLVTSGPLLLALPVAAAAGAVTFLSPCCLPLVPGYLSFVTGMAGAGGAPAAAVPAAAPAAAAAVDGSAADGPSDGGRGRRRTGPGSRSPLPRWPPPRRFRRAAGWSPGRRCSCSASPSCSWPTARPSAGSGTCSPGTPGR